MVEAKEGDTVKVHYKGMLENGEVFHDSKSNDQAPAELTLGEGNIIPGFEEAVKGMSPGDIITEDIFCEEAYGKRNEDLVDTIDRSELPEDLDPELGQQLQMKLQDGRQIPAVVTEKNESSIAIDANPPLAGHDLKFQIELIEIL